MKYGLQNSNVTGPDDTSHEIACIFRSNYTPARKRISTRERNRNESNIEPAIFAKVD